MKNNFFHPSSLWVRMIIVEEGKKGNYSSCRSRSVIFTCNKGDAKRNVTVFYKSIIQYIVEGTIEPGIEDIIIVTGKGKRTIGEHFEHSSELERNLLLKGKHEILEKVQESSKINIHYILQKEPKGFG